MQLIDGKPVFAATDLVGYLACEHRFGLERAALAGLVEKPIRNDPAIEAVARRGDEHERRYLSELEASGRTIVRIDRDGSASDQGAFLRAAEAETVAAMRAGADVIYQATFFDGRWRGHADFLLRVERPSNLGAWSYEVADTKLARRTKASAVLQVCSYVEQVTRVQGAQPEWLHIVLGGSRRQADCLRVADFMAYYRRVKADFEAAWATAAAAYPPLDTYPDPVEHCEVCRWAVDCRARRRADDDLSLVAGISARQRRGLKDAGVATRRGLAALSLPPGRLAWSGRDAAVRVREQARIQVEAEDANEPRWEYLLPLDTDPAGDLVANRGFLVLPRPSPSDLFFDIEGDPFALDDGVDYLFGVLEPARHDPERRDEPLFHAIWSREAGGEVTLAAEKAAFEALVDLVIARLDADPTLHVYHYAAYERTALARLAQRHATREEEVDRLLRQGVLVDLYRAVRQGIRAGVESYSIKKLEPLYGLDREVELRSAGSSIVAFEAWLEGVPTEDGRVGQAILDEIEGYNRDDVISNWRLRDWLEERRTQLELQLGRTLPRAEPPPSTGVVTPTGDRAQRVAALRERLLAGIPEDPGAGTPEEKATWLLAQLLGWHRREDKAYWWRFFELCGMTNEELIEEREPIGGLTLDEDLGPSGRGGRLQRFRFPPQDHALRVGGDVTDPETRNATGEIRDVDDLAGTITLHRTATQVRQGLPRGLVPSDHVRTDDMEEALLRLGAHVADHGIGGPGPWRAARDLLLGLPPRAGQAPGAVLRPDGKVLVDAAREIATRLDQTALPVQGPPGSGKTYAGARMIRSLVSLPRPARVGVMANSHKVIGNMLDEVIDAHRQEGGPPATIGQKPGRDEPPTCRDARGIKDASEAASLLASGEVDVVGGTVWLWSDAALDGSLDVLVVDEAGQVSLANVLAAAGAASSIILIGDPQQLDQPTKGSHPPGAERSALAHVLRGRQTIDPTEGLFMDRTWRLHPDLCAFTSELFYDSALLPEESTARQALDAGPPLTGTGLRWVPVAHEDNRTDSPEEAAVVSRLVAGFTGAACWTNRKGEERPVGPQDVLIVAPYNAHVDRIADAVGDGARVGTVDKFQGQEAPVAIYALGTSSPELAPRGMEFLYSLNRLNVATSRARCLAVVVGSPALLRVQCHTPRQMRLANALARLVEVSEAQARRG